METIIAFILLKIAFWFFVIYQIYRAINTAFNAGERYLDLREQRYQTQQQHAQLQHQRYLENLTEYHRYDHPQRYYDFVQQQWIKSAEN